MFLLCFENIYIYLKNTDMYIIEESVCVSQVMGVVRAGRGGFFVVGRRGGVLFY
jgi:hypothetical protein